ncbi:hypothetical protein [Brochothrix campestris]|uniref:Phage tail protein n=1 Tax=Brochothrix campestris FSL F6-1037 TaxID=1265861 RepID=W7D206_9LIST|nr:hypothetical protein [Brochothrix campestris]EUJ41981.1 hypothetical protein BCAMP_01200 [Brochothrix campestris FSL F6-1037]
MSVPYFIFNNQHSLIDYDCIIENELHEVSAEERVEVIKITGRNGSLHRSYGDYDSFTYEIKDITIPCDRLDDVRGWLRGSGDLILHTDKDKCRKARVLMGAPFQYENEWGVFYTFSVSFECQPFRYKVVDPVIDLETGVNRLFDAGTESAKPVFYIESLGGDLVFVINGDTFSLMNTKAGFITLDSELGQAIFDGAIVKSKGKYPQLQPGLNEIEVNGAFKRVSLQKRSVWY